MQVLTVYYLKYKWKRNKNVKKQPVKKPKFQKGKRKGFTKRQKQMEKYTITGCYLYPKQYKYIVDDKFGGRVKAQLAKGPTTVSLLTQNPDKKKNIIVRSLVMNVTNASKNDEKEYKHIFSGKYMGKPFNPFIKPAEKLELQALDDYMKKMMGQ